MTKTEGAVAQYSKYSTPGERLSSLRGLSSSIMLTSARQTGHRLSLWRCYSTARHATWSSGLPILKRMNESRQRGERSPLGQWLLILTWMP